MAKFYREATLFPFRRKEIQSSIKANFRWESERRHSAPRHSSKRWSDRSENNETKRWARDSGSSCSIRRTFEAIKDGKKNKHRGPTFAATRHLCLFMVWIKALTSRNRYTITRTQRRSQGGCWRGSSTSLSDQNIDVYFLVFHQHCAVSRDRVHCKMFFGSPAGVATHSLSNQAVMNFRDLRNLEAAFFIPACFALPYITRAGCCRALPVWKQAWHLNYQQCRLMCSFYVTKLRPS